MDDNEYDEVERAAEAALVREFRDVSSTFKYFVETERRVYLANEVELKRIDTATDFYFELKLRDVWVWDQFRTDRFVKSVNILTFKDVNVEELEGRGFDLPKDLSVGQ
ncbi:MAG: hypothetical protein RL556_350 [Actinomycetota bacterium]|jgi:hypothetical protein